MKITRVRGCAVLLIGAIILGCAALIFVIQWAGQSLTSLGDQANAFMLAIREDRMEDAYDQLTDDLQARISLSAFRENLVSRGIEDCRFMSFDVNNNNGLVQGTLTSRDGTNDLRLSLIYEAERWRVTGFTVLNDLLTG